MTLTGSAQTLYQRTEKCAGSTGRLNGCESRKITLSRISDQIEDQLDDPFARKYFSMLAIGIRGQIWEYLGNEGKLTHMTGFLDRTAVHYLF